ncbi:MAG: OmpA family protein [Omnitrophica bacterium]|nr:OmpA family protein [Candidatus Omnitrophota bacterium]
MKRLIVLVMLLALITTSGCAFRFYKKNPRDKETIDQLASEVKNLKKLRAEERRQFVEIEKALRKELKGQKVKLDMEKRGLVITLADNILFDSGKAKIKAEAYPVLEKIADVITSYAADKSIGVEGHTDNIPIQHSPWKSNRELSTSRANNVYHYLIAKGGMHPAKLTTIGYGEFRPIATNNTSSGRAKNRRVEIVILPQYLKKPASEIKGKNWVK